MILNGYTILPARGCPRMERVKRTAVVISREGRVVKRFLFPLELAALRRAWHRAIDWTNRQAKKE